MSTIDKVKSKKGRLPFVTPKRQLTRRTKYIQPIEEKTFGIVSDDSIRSGLRTTNTRGRRARSRRFGKLKFPLVPSNIPSIRHGVISTNHKFFEKDVYVAEDNLEYHIGDSVYIQSDTISSVYFIGQILDFRTTRKEERLVEIQWYYRPSEVPASVLDSLLQDRIIQSKNHEETISSLLNDPHVRTRELFRCGSTNNGENFNLTPTTNIKGKCSVLSLSDIINLRDYTSGEDNFFCILGFDPITRRLSDFKGEIRVGPSHQASLPPFSPDMSLLKMDTAEDLLWDPNYFEDSELQMYLKATRSVAMHAGWCLRGRIEDGLMAMQSDLLTQQSYDLLHHSGYCTRKALKSLVDFPNAYDMIYEKTWCREEIKNFQKGIKKFGKQFKKICVEFLPHKTFEDVIRFYYFWKKSPSGLANRNMRKSRKSIHLKKSHLEHVLPYPCLSDLFVDVISSDEFDSINLSRDSEKNDDILFNKSEYSICQHCYCSRSQSWHHGGSDNTLLCNTCRLYYCKYGLMRIIIDKGDPPLHILKDASNLELIKQINAGSYTLQSKLVEEQGDSSELSESSDYESILSDVEKVDTDVHKAEYATTIHRSCSQNLYNSSVLTETKDVSVFSNSNAYKQNKPKQNLYIDHESVRIESFQNQSQDLCPLQNLKISSDLEQRSSQDCINQINISPVHENMSNNTSILKSLLESKDEKTFKHRSTIRVIIHDQYGQEMSRVIYDDVADDCDSNSNSEPSSPDTLKKDFVLIASDPRQGAARLDYIPKANITELILERKCNHNSEEFRHRSSELPGKCAPKIKDNVLLSRNLPFSEKSPPPQSPFPPLSIIPTTPQLQNIPSNTYLSSNLSQFISNNHGSSMIPCPIGPIGSQRETTKLIFGSSNSSIDHQHIKDNSVLRNIQIHKSKPMSNSSNASIGGQFTGQFMTPLSISTSSTSITPSTYINNIFQNEVPESILKNALIKQENPEGSSLKTSNSECLTPGSNIPFISKNLPAASNIIISNYSNRVKLDAHTNDASKGVFHHPHQNNQLQPQIPMLNQVDPVNTSQIQSISNNQLQTSNEFQIPSQPVSTPCISLPHLNGLHTLLNNNIIVAPLQENRLNNIHSTPSGSNPLEAIPYTIEQNKQAYQQYISYLQNQLYSQQLNAFMLSQMQSPTQPIHTQMTQPQMNLQISQPLPLHINSSQNQSAGIRAQVQSLSLPGIIPYSNDPFTQLSTYSSPNDRDSVTNNTKNSEKK